MKALSFDDAKKEIKNKIVDFLVDSGVKHNKYKTMFNCIFPDHNDHAPSLHIFESYSGDKIGYCMGCNRVLDTFVANSVMNNKPFLGYEFVTENMKPLADMYGIDFDMKPLTQEEIEEMNIKSLNKMIADMVVYNLKNVKPQDNNVNKYIDERDLRDAAEYNIGYVHNWDDFKLDVMKRGVTEEQLAKADITERIFNPNNLIFCIADESGAIRGFAGRNCNFDEENKIGSKYINTSNNQIYVKRALLYNLNKAAKRKVGKYSSLYITEGYTDAIALDKIGLKAVAIGSTKFTEEHISLLQRIGETDIVLLLDGDDAGIKNTARTITEVMEGVRSFRTRIVTLPDALDPDEFVRKYGKEALLDLPHISAFEWRLIHLQLQTDLDPHELAGQVIPLIVNESSELQRDKMCTQLHEITSIPIDTIRREVHKLADDDKMRIQTERENIIDNVIRSLRKNPDDAQIILSDGQNTLRSISEKYHADKYNELEYINELQNLKLRQELAGDEDVLYLNKMPRLEQLWDGNTTGKLFLLGGQPGAGKSSFLVSIVCSMLTAAEGAGHWDQEANQDREKNLCILYHTIDDSRDEIIPRFLAHLAAPFHPEVCINAMSAPERVFLKDREGFMKARDDAYEKLMRWAKDGRLIIKDATTGATLTAAQNVIRNLKHKYTDRHIVYICDNLYNLADFSNMEEKQRIGEITRVLKQEIAVVEKIMCLCTVEYRKGSDNVKSAQAMNELVRQGKEIEYHANWLGHLFNEMYTDPKNTPLYFWDPSLPIDEAHIENRKPIVRLIVGKTKLNDVKGGSFYYFLDHKATLLELNAKDVQAAEGPLRDELNKYYRIPEHTLPARALDTMPRIGDINELFN